jgi:hypothetical protein
VAKVAINDDEIVLQKQVEQLKERSKDNEYIVKAKLQEKDDQLKNMQNQFAVLQSQVQVLISTLGSTNLRRIASIITILLWPYSN